MGETKKKERNKRKNKAKVKTTINKQNKQRQHAATEIHTEVQDSAKLYRCVSWRLLMFNKENMQQRHKYNKK